MADTKTQRDARLDQLNTLVQQWSTQRTQELKQRVTFLTNVLQARGEGQLLQATAVAATALVVNSINDFLTGVQ